MTHTLKYLQEASQICAELDISKIENMARKLSTLRKREGRLFILGVGGSAANSAHAVNDFRKLCHLEAYAPTDNVSELTARTNDEGWETVFERWLDISKLSANDAVLVLSVGGGNAEKNVSMNIVQALKLAQQRDADIFGIVGRDGGYTELVGDPVVIIPSVRPEHVTPHTESFQALVWHCLVSHPLLQIQQTKW